MVTLLAHFAILKHDRICLNDKMYLILLATFLFFKIHIHFVVIDAFFFLLQINAQQVTVQTQQQTSQQQKVTYTTQPAIKTQFLTTPISQTQKPGGTQQVQAQIQVQVTQFYTFKHYCDWITLKLTGDVAF